MAHTLYFPVFTCSSGRTPMSKQLSKPLAGCQLMRVDTRQGRPRVPAFMHAEDAQKVIEAAKVMAVVYEIGGHLLYDIPKVPGDLDVGFVYHCDAARIAGDIGSYVCDECVYVDGVVVVMRSWSVERLSSRDPGDLEDEVMGR
jgi:hypothetical protein